MRYFIGVICALVVFCILIYTRTLFSTPDFVIGVCVTTAFFGGRDGYDELKKEREWM